ncbi:hypothetical protein UFOVP98_17 [uncultured Caudovirales phage]|uniref:Uncharacterized protein n=1 Tax=uncultured Caudovirales phage TaxID=2100421 RepID=A0A6J5KZ18_9CAUD|nr:hypothetical protein UFOVP98_17 [uncultured Caudovirales phage]CAB4134429.1 hypothetical protein UFOVP269_53 [uncultured Caudovirales phage]
MIDDLLNSNKITPSEFKLYRLFTSELGESCLKTLMEELFWEEPNENDFRGETFAFYDGRRSVIRGIVATIQKVEHIIHEQNLEVTND